MNDKSRRSFLGRCCGSVGTVLRRMQSLGDDRGKRQEP